MSESAISEIDALKIIDETIDKIADVDGKKRIVEWIVSKHLGVSKDSFFEESKKPEKKKPTKNSNKKSSSTKISFSIIKDLVLNPTNKISLRDFIKEKKPSNLKEKCVVCIYYLTKELELTNINVNHLYTCFKNAEWKVPKDFKNMLHQTGSEGWLDTKDGNDLLVTPIGENLIEHDLPRPEKAK